MKLKTVVCCSLLALGVSFTAQAGKLYKIVDKDGNVTFSQFPPQPAENKELTVDKLHIKNENATSISRKGSYMYCGKIKLPKIDKTDPEDLLSLKQFRDEWERELHGDSELTDVAIRMKLNRYNISRDPAKSGQRKRDLRCAIQWVDQHKEEVANAKVEIKEKSESLNKSIARVKAERERRCGSEPQKDPNRPSTKEAWRQWRDCYYSYSDKLYELESQASELRY